jgi:thiol-disulfide isomerase/thioredoxin
MKKIHLILTLSILFFGCQSSPKEKTQEPLEVETLIGEEGETVVLGFLNRANLDTPEFQAWFQPEYDLLKIPEGWIEEHKPLAKDLTFKLFLGTWCGDTQRELGGMFKLLDALGVNQDQIEMYGVSEAKDSPQGYEKEYDILNIPTLIFIENGIENNRIVEFPVESMIEDFSKILKKQPYQDAYADF